MRRISVFVTIALLAGFIVGFFSRSAAGMLQRSTHAADLAAIEKLHQEDIDVTLSQDPKGLADVWAEDGVLTVVSTTATAGNYVGNGDPDDPATCPEPTGDTSAGGKQGTLCTFFKYLAGGLQAANKFVSLSPEYKTKFVPVWEDGQWKSSVYFECHYFDVSLNPATGLPFWTAKSHVDVDGVAKKIDGKWLLTKVSSGAVGIPIP